MTIISRNKKQEANILLKKIEESLLLKVLVCITLSLFVIIFYLSISKIIDKVKFRKYKIEESFKIVTTIENIIKDKEEIKLNGYAFVLDRNSYDSTISVVLHNINSGKDIWLKTDIVKRSDVEMFFESEHDYSNSGFVASVDYDKLVTDIPYEIIVNIDYKDTVVKKSIRKTVSTRQYILNGELFNYNPVDIKNPEMNVKSNLLKNVFANGKLCLYQEDEGLYIYQYEDKLYWIATDDFIFDKSESTYIIYHVYVANVDKLPKNRIEYKFDNLDFRFEEYEFKDENTDPYRIAIRDIPKDYAITYINTGVYDYSNKKSLWTQSFQIENLIKNNK